MDLSVNLMGMFYKPSKTFCVAICVSLYGILDIYTDFIVIRDIYFNDCIKVSEGYLSEVMNGDWRPGNNFCEDYLGQDVDSEVRPLPEGDEDENSCKVMCAKDIECSGIEWIEGSREERPCRLIRGKKNMADRSAKGDSDQKVKCLVKPNWEGEIDSEDLDDVGQKICKLSEAMCGVFVFTIVLDVLRALMKIYFMYCGSDADTFICCKAFFGFAFLFFEDVAQIALLGNVMKERKEGGDEISGQEQFSMAISIFSIVITFLGICMNCCKYCGGKTDEAKDELYAIQVNEK